MSIGDHILSGNRWIALAVAASFLTAVYAVISVEGNNQPVQTQERFSVVEDALLNCIKATEVSLQLTRPTFDDYAQIWNLCGNEVYNNLLLEDFVIRREKFIRQELDERVNLGLVVIMTLAGVAFAGIQLLTSYKLAISGHNVGSELSELTIQKDRISLKSSYIGVLVLVISLAFFFVYVRWIYRQEDVTVERPSNLSSVQATVAGRQGGLGAPPVANVPSTPANSPAAPAASH